MQQKAGLKLPSAPGGGVLLRGWLVRGNGNAQYSMLLGFKFWNFDLLYLKIRIILQNLDQVVISKLIILKCKFLGPILNLSHMPGKKYGVSGGVRTLLCRTPDELCVSLVQPAHVLIDLKVLLKSSA